MSTLSLALSLSLRGVGKAAVQLSPGARAHTRGFAGKSFPGYLPPEGLAVLKAPLRKEATLPPTERRRLPLALDEHPLCRLPLAMVAWCPSGTQLFPLRTRNMTKVTKDCIYIYIYISLSLSLSLSFFLQGIGVGWPDPQAFGIFMYISLSLSFSNISLSLSLFAVSLSTERYE